MRNVNIMNIGNKIGCNGLMLSWSFATVCRTAQHNYIPALRVHVQRTLLQKNEPFN